MTERRRFSVENSLPIGSRGAVFTVALFTNKRYLSFTWRHKEITRITKDWRLWWKMQAAGNSLSVGRSLSLIVLYFRIFENPFWNLVCTSDRKAVLVSIDLASMWGPCIISDSIFSVDNYAPQLIGQLSVENDCSRCFSQWWVVYVHVHMSPSLHILSLVFIPSGIELSLLIN